MATFRAKIKRTKKDYIKATKDAANAMVLAVAKVGEAESKKIAKTGKQVTGTLARSIQAKRVRNYVAEWATNIVYAIIQEFGGIIRPKRAKFLVFRPAGASYLVFAKSVQIPPKAFMRRGAWAARRKLQKIGKALFRKTYAQARVVNG